MKHPVLKQIVSFELITMRYVLKILFLTKQLNESLSGNAIAKSASEREEELASKIHIQVAFCLPVVDCLFVF